METKLKLKNDLIFKAFFSKKGNEKYLKSFLESLLQIEIDEIEIIGEATLLQMTQRAKLGRMDIKPVILINILNYNLLEVPEYCTKTVTVAERHREYEVIKDVTYYFIELPKFRESKPRLANRLECWLALIDNEDRGLIEMAEKKEKIIKEANKEVEEILSDAVIRELNEYEQTAAWEENSKIGYAKRKGKKEEKIKIAKKLIEMKLPLEDIIKATELTKEEIEKI